MESSSSKPSEVALITTALSSVDGAAGVLAVRGVPIEALAERRYAEVGAFLIDGRWPNDGGAAFAKRLAAQTLPAQVSSSPSMIAAMAALRRGLADVDAAVDDEVAFSGAVARLVAGLRGRTPRRDDLAGAILEGVSDATIDSRVDDEAVAVLEAAMILHIDHALNPGTLCVRVTASTGATLASCLTAGLCALEGPLHGGASSNVGAVLERLRSPADVAAFVDDERSAKRRLPGFGHPIYRGRDPRTAVLKALTERAAKLRGDHRLLDVAVALEEAAVRQSGGRLFANVDFYAAAVYASLGIPLWLHTPMFAAARVLGWTAHVVEERARRKIISPEGGYDGVPQRSLQSVIDDG